MEAITRRKNALYKMLQQWGWFNLGLFVLNRFLVMVSKGSLRFYRYYLIAQPVAKTTLLPPGRGKKIEIRLIHEQDEIILQFPRPPTAIRERFEQGAKCLVAFRGTVYRLSVAITGQLPGRRSARPLHSVARRADSLGFRCICGTRLSFGIDFSALMG